MSNDYFGKSALITGGSSGIGLALAKQLFTSGANVWLVARNEDRLLAAQGEIEALRTNQAQEICIFPIDVSAEKEVSVALKNILAAKGAPDLVINCAGVAHPGLFEKTGDDIFHWMMDVNYFGTVNVTKAVIEPMLKRGSGHIVNVSSIAGFIGVYGYTAYGASKYAVRGFSDALRAELKPRGIKVSVVFPPDTDTPQLAYENQFKPAATKALSGSSKAMTAEAVASAVLQGVHRNQPAIIPGMENQWIYRLSHLVGDLVYPIMDWMVQSALRNSNGSKSH